MSIYSLNKIQIYMENVFSTTDPPKVKREQRILTNWSSWLHCNETTEKLRTRHLCVKNSSSQYWTCNDFGVERIDHPVTTTYHPVTTTATSTVNPTTGISTLDSTTSPSFETSTSEITTKSQTSSTLSTTEQSTLPSTPNVGCRVTTSGTVPSTMTSTDGSSSTTSTTTIATENATTSYGEKPTDSVPSTTATEVTTPTGMVK